MEPCSNASATTHLIIACGTVLTSLFTAFLAHRRLKADRDRKLLEEVLIDYLGVPGRRLAELRKAQGRGNGK